MYLYQIGEAGLAVGVHDNLALVCSVLWAWRFRFSRHGHVYGLLALHSYNCLLLSQYMVIPELARVFCQRKWLSLQL